MYTFHFLHVCTLSYCLYSLHSWLCMQQPLCIIQSPCIYVALSLVAMYSYVTGYVYHHGIFCRIHNLLVVIRNCMVTVLYCSYAAMLLRFNLYLMFNSIIYKLWRILPNLFSYVIIYHTYQVNLNKELEYN